MPVLVWDIITDPGNPTKMTVSHPNSVGWEVTVMADRVTF